MPQPDESLAAADGAASPVLAPAPAAAPAAGGVRAELRAAVGLIGGRPALTERYHTAPLKIAKAFALGEDSLGGSAGAELAVLQMDVSPGLLDGDRYRYDWTIGPGARAYVTNQAYTRVHPSRRLGAQAEQRLRLARGAVLSWMPEPVMLFRDADYRCATEIDLEPEAVVFYADLFCPGRVARGESFDFAAYDSRLTVRYAGELIHYQRQRWIPGKPAIDAPGGFGGFTHLASLSVFADRADAAAAERLERLLADGGGLPPEVYAAVARTARHGIVVQLAGRRTWPLQQAVRAAWDAARAALLDAPPIRLLNEQTLPAGPSPMT